MVGALGALVKHAEALRGSGGECSRMNRARRRLRHAAGAGDARALQAAAADLRHADDLPSRVHADARGRARDPDHLHPARHAAAARPPGQRV